MNETKKPIVIKGAANIRELLQEYLESNESAKYFDFEEDKMYSKRESERIQQHLQKYGEMPGRGSEEDVTIQLRGETSASKTVIATPLESGGSNLPR